MEVLKWAARTGAFIIEDDYDSEYRFDGFPLPALQGLDRGSNVIFVGTFTKLLFSSLRLGYIVLPASLIDVFVSFRRGADLRSTGFDQAVLCDFIVDGHLERHLRRMRDLYARRLEALGDYGRRYLSGLLELSDVKAGLYTAALSRSVAEGDLPVVQLRWQDGARISSFNVQKMAFPAGRCFVGRSGSMERITKVV